MLFFRFAMLVFNVSVTGFLKRLENSKTTIHSKSSFNQTGPITQWLRHYYRCRRFGVRLPALTNRTLWCQRLATAATFLGAVLPRR